MRQRVQWKPSNIGWFKINSNGSFSCSSGQGAGAVVIHNHDGVVLVAESRWYGPIHDALIAEALAARDGLYLAQQIVLQNICWSVITLSL
jgi:hypothetical protein